MIDRNTKPNKQKGKEDIEIDKEIRISGGNDYRQRGTGKGIGGGRINWETGEFRIRDIAERGVFQMA